MGHEEFDDHSFSSDGSYAKLAFIASRNLQTGEVEVDPHDNAEPFREGLVGVALEWLVSRHDLPHPDLRAPEVL